MTKEQIGKLEILFDKRKEIQAFVNCNSNICRINFNDEWSDSDNESLWEKIRMVNAEDFKQDVIKLAEQYLYSIDKQIEDVITEVK
jgi:hypothetical protein